MKIAVGRLQAEGVLHHVVRARSGRNNVFSAPPEGREGGGEAGVAAGGLAKPGRGGPPGMLHGPSMWQFFFASDEVRSCLFDQGDLLYSGEERGIKPPRTAIRCEPKQRPSGRACSMVDCPSCAAPP